MIKISNFLVLFIGILGLCSFKKQTNNPPIKYKTYHILTDSGYTFYADNKELLPLSVKIKIEGKNLTPLYKPLLVVPAQTDSFVIGKLIRTHTSGEQRFSYSTDVVMGDITAQPNENYVYDLPFLPKKNFRVDQGYNGQKTHQNLMAIDFDMPEGTPICAARAGVIIENIDSNYQNCYHISCLHKANYITILHNDGTAATYSHLKHKGSAVKLGQKVQQGQLIAYSGNTGFSSGPHLHFMCFVYTQTSIKSIATQFKTTTKIEYLTEGKTYKKE